VEKKIDIPFNFFYIVYFGEKMLEQGTISLTLFLFSLWLPNPEN